MLIQKHELIGFYKLGHNYMYHINKILKLTHLILYREQLVMSETFHSKRTIKLAADSPYKQNFVDTSVLLGNLEWDNFHDYVITAKICRSNSICIDVIN